MIQNLCTVAVDNNRHNTPILNPKEVYKKIPPKRPMGYDKGVLWEFKTGFT